MGQGTICDIMLPVGWLWAPLTIVWKFVVMKKCTSASQDFLESSSNHEYYHAEWPPKVLWDSTGKLGPQIDMKLSTWQRFIRIQQNIWGKLSKISPIRDTLTLWTCADRITQITCFWKICYGHLSTILHLLGLFWEWWHRRGCLLKSGLAEALWLSVGYITVFEIIGGHVWMSYRKSIAWR